MKIKFSLSFLLIMLLVACSAESSSQYDEKSSQSTMKGVFDAFIHNVYTQEGFSREVECKVKDEAIAKIYIEDDDHDNAYIGIAKYNKAGVLEVYRSEPNRALVHNLYASNDDPKVRTYEAKGDRGGDRTLVVEGIVKENENETNIEIQRGENDEIGTEIGSIRVELINAEDATKAKRIILYRSKDTTGDSFLTIGPCT